MRDALLLVLVVLALALCGLILYLKAPQSRLLRSAVLAGIVVGRVAFGEAW